LLERGREPLNLPRFPREVFFWEKVSPKRKKKVRRKKTSPEGERRR